MKEILCCCLGKDPAEGWGLLWAGTALRRLQNPTAFLFYSSGS
jgi:hypothetical protein